MKILTPAGKRPIRSTLCFFSAGQQGTQGGEWKKAKIINRIYKTIKNQIIYIKFATIRRTKLVKITHVVEAGKIFSSKATGITVCETKIFKKRRLISC